jgi:hypothetical protein
MLEGLADVEEALGKRGIKFVVRRGSPDDVALEAGKNASLIVTDRGYMRPQKRWRKRVAGEAECPVTQVSPRWSCPWGSHQESERQRRGLSDPGSGNTSTTS